MGPARSDLLERGFRPVVIERWLRVYWDSLRRDTEGAKEHFREVLETYVETKSTTNIAHVLNGFAMVANDEGKHERAARLLGAAARIRKESGGGAPPELMTRLGDPDAEPRKALGEDAFERAHGEGHAMTIEEGVSYALQEENE